MKKKEFIEFVNSGEYLSLEALGNAMYDNNRMDKEIPEIKTDLNIERHDDYESCTSIFKCEDGFVAVHGLSYIYKDGIYPDDILFLDPCEASESNMFSIVDVNINKILEKYGHDCPSPESSTIKDGNNWYHFEFDPCYGLVAYYDESDFHCNIDGKKQFFIKSLNCLITENDDETWTVSKDPLLIQATMIKSMTKTIVKLNKWLNEHFDLAHDNKVIKEI